MTMSKERLDGKNNHQKPSISPRGAEVRENISHIARFEKLVSLADLRFQQNPNPPPAPQATTIGIVQHAATLLNWCSDTRELLLANLILQDLRLHPNCAESYRSYHKRRQWIVQYVQYEKDACMTNMPKAKTTYKLQIRAHFFS